MTDDLDSHLLEAETTALHCTQRIHEEPDRALVLRDAILSLLELLSGQDDATSRRRVLDVLLRVVPLCVDALHEVRQLLQTDATRANPLLKAMLSALTSLAEKDEPVLATVLSDLVTLIHQLCHTSMTTADVVVLFEFLRVSCSPARRLILQMQMALLEGETMPRAVFAMHGVHAGIIAPSTQLVFSKKGYSLSFGLLLGVGASVVSLYSFRGSGGQGVSGMIEGTTLLLKMHGANGATSQVAVPFAQWRVKMETEWVHLCVVHSKKMVFKDKIAVFADGTSIFNGNLSYPDPLSMVGGQNGIGVIPTVAASFQGRMWSPTLFGQPLSDTDVQKLHWLTHWKTDLGSVAAENTGLSDKSRVIFSYDARSCDPEKRLCFDVSGNECHGWMEPGTKSVVTQGLRQAMDSVGGSSCFLLLLLDQIPELADFHPNHELTQDEISDLMAFVAIGLRTSVACRAHFLRLRGVNVLAFVLQSVSPQYLSLSVLTSVTSIITTILESAPSPDDSIEFIDLLLFRNANWFLSPYETQVTLLGEVLPFYLKSRDEMLGTRSQSQKTPGMAAAASAMEALGIAPTSVGSSLDTSPTSCAIDVNFFCNLLVQVYAPRLCSGAEGQKTVAQMHTLRQLVIDKLLDRLLCPSPSTDDVYPWRQLLAHLHRRSLKVTANAFAQDGEGIELKELMEYIVKTLVSESTGTQHQQQRQTVSTKLGKLGNGTLRLLWHTMHSPVPDLRLGALRVLEAYCTDKITLKRRDAAMLVAACQAYPIELADAHVLLDLIIGRRHTSFYGSPSSSSSAAGSGRSINVARLEFVPTVLLQLLPEADFTVQAHVLYEVKVLAASPSFGQVAVEAIRSWPSWLSRLHRLIQRASMKASESATTTTERQQSTCGLSPHALNDICAVLSDENSPVAAKIDAIHAIGESGDIRGCDFMVSVFQNADLPASVIKAIAMAIQDHFPSRCSALTAKIAKQVIVDVLVYSILHVRNGWLHYLEFVFYSSQQTSDLCAMTASMVERVVRRLSHRSSGSTAHEPSEFMWENLSQVAAIISIAPAMIEQRPPADSSRMSQGQRRILCRKAYDLWQHVLPRLHLINWEELKGQLLLNASFCDDVPAEDKEIFCFLVAGSANARCLTLECFLSNLRFAQEADEFHLGHVTHLKKTLEQLRLIAPEPRRQSTTTQHQLQHRSSLSSSPPSSLSLSPGTVANALASYTSDAFVFFGEARCREARVPRELVHLHTLDALYEALTHQLEGGRTDEQSFRAAQSLVELIVALAAAVLRVQATPKDGATVIPAEVVKSLQIVISTDVSFFLDVGQLQQLLGLWKPHRDLHTRFCDREKLEGEYEELRQAFLRRWNRLFENQSVEFNPYLIQKDASSLAELLTQESAACEALWQALLDQVAEGDASVAEAALRGLPSSLKQDAEKFASSVHKLILHSCRSPRSSTIDNGSSGRGSEQLGASTGSQATLWKVDSRESVMRMRLRLKQVRDNYRLRNLSLEYGENPMQVDEYARRSGSFQLGPRRFKSARDNLRYSEGDAGEVDKSWRSEAGSDYSDFLADAQMRAAIIRSCPSVSSDRDSFSGDLSADEVDADDDDVADDEGDAGQSDDNVEATFDQEARKLSADAQPITAVSETPPPPPPAPAVGSSSAKPSSPLGAFSGFGASLLSVVGGVSDLVSKAAKDAKDAVELGVDSLYTARDALSDDAHALVQEVNASLADATHKTPSASEARSPAPTADCKRLTVAVSLDPPTLQQRDDGPVLFPSSPPTQKAASRQHGPRSTEEESNTAALARKNSIGSSREVEFDANLVRHMHVVAGKLVLTETHLWFLAEQVIDEHETVLAERKRGVPIASAWQFLFKRRRWKLDDIASVHRRRYLLKPAALEFFIHSTRKNYFFSLKMEDIGRLHESLMARRPAILRRDPTMRRLRHPSSIFRNSNMSVRWMNHEVSTFEYLMWLNTIAGRTYNDLTQYPVFPWVLADYESSTLDLSRAATFRDLTKPMGALDPARLKFFLDRYNTFEDSDIPKFMYGTHYSNIGVVLYYLIRLEPFTTYALSVQGGKFDHADRLFHSVAETWHNCLHDFNDVKELTPEWFYQPEFLKNCNSLEMGAKQSGVALGDVVLPPWASSPEDFVLKNFMALESEYVSQHIHKWIDLIFGATQRGPAAVDAHNVFFYLTYEGMVDVDAITDPVTKSSMRAQIAHFGQTPTQVLRDPHPPRLALVSKSRRASNAMMEPPPLPLLSTSPPPPPPKISPSDARWTTLAVPHDSPIALLHLVPGSTSMLCVDTLGQLSMHRYSTKSVKVHHTPLLNDLSTTATKASGVFKPPPSSGSSPLLGPSTPPSQAANGTDASSTEYLELHDRKSRKIIGDKRLLARSETAPQTRVAFLNSGTVYCSVGHHDFSARFHSSSDGALLYRLLQHHAVVNCVGTSSTGALLALGASDGTISVWKVAHIASTLLDSIKIFRAAKNQSRPVHANDYAADQVLLGHAGAVNCVAVSEDLAVCVSGSVSNECLVHDLSDGSILQQLAVPGSDAPGVVSIALSPIGLVVVQSMGLGSPALYVFHLNGSLLASTTLEGDRPMAAMSVCTRYCKVILSNRDVAVSYSLLSLRDRELLLDKSEYGEIGSLALSPDETHVVLSVGSGKLVARSLVPLQ